MRERKHRGHGVAARSAVVLACALLASLSPRAPAQDPADDEGVAPTWRIGVLFWHESPNAQTALEGVRSALRGRRCELIVEQAASSRDEALRILESFREKPVDLVLAMGTEAALLAAERIHEIPVVFTAVTNPVESGVVGSWRGSERNLAGNSNWIAPETVLHGFQLAVPKLERLGMLRSKGSGVVSAAELREMRRHLALPGSPDVEIVEAVVDRAEAIPDAVSRLVAAGVQAIWIGIDFLVYENTQVVLDALRGTGIPIVSSSLRGTRTGAAAGIVVDYSMLGERAALIALDVLERGVDPGTIPVGTMAGYRVTVNLEAARDCGYELPLSLLVVADVLLERLEQRGVERDARK
jgi:putative ABC transport system substrate-binding protein